MFIETSILLIYKFPAQRQAKFPFLSLKMFHLIFALIYFPQFAKASELIENHLQIGLVELEPFCMKDANGSETGFLVDLMYELLDRVNKSGTQTVTYSTYWIELGNETSEIEMWNAVRKELLNGNADVVLVPLADTSGWNGVVQLSQPYLLAPIISLPSRMIPGKE